MAAGIVCRSGNDPGNPAFSLLSVIIERSIDARGNFLWRTLEEILSSDYNHYVKIGYYPLKKAGIFTD